ncbi:MAG: hypothetical protein GEV08_15315 [Acidimicrobiia bacterium]|nr:hypothetical protein [Acidimicrobiia bacterium]
MATTGGANSTLGDESWPADGADRFVADARIDEAALARSRERWLRQQAAEAATLEGICRDLAERGEFVLATTTAGTRHRGRIDMLGEDFLAVRSGGGAVLVPYEGLHTIEVQGTAEPGERLVRRGLTLAEVLTELAQQRPAVRLRCRNGDALVGELRHGGRDLVAVRVGLGGRRTVYVRLSSLAELSVLSG